MGSKLTLSLPEGLTGLRAPASVLDENLALVGRTTLGAPAAIELDPGIYAARAVLPDGRAFEAAFEIRTAGEAAEVKLKDAAAVAFPWGDAGSAQLESAYAGLESAARDTMAQGQELAFPIRPGASAGSPTAGEAAEADAAGAPPPLSLVSCDASGNVRAETALTADAAGVVTIDPKEAACFLRIKGAGGSDFCVAAPVSASERATFRLLPGGPTSFAMTLEDERADMLLRYLDRGRIEQLPQLVADYWSIAESLLEAKSARPIAATVGAYVILSAGPPGAEDGDYLSPGNWLDRWTGNLFRGFPWLADGLCIRAELLARQGTHGEALDLLLTLPGRDLPMFSLGLRFALDRLTGYRNAAASGKLEERYVEAIYHALDTLYWIAARADFERPVLAFALPADARGGFREWPREPPRPPAR